MTITQVVQNLQQQRIDGISQRTQGKSPVNPYGTPGMSLNDASNYRKFFPMNERVIRQVKQIAFDQMFHNEATRLGEFVHQQDPSWNWGKPFDTSILDRYQQGMNTMI